MVEGPQISRLHDHINNWLYDIPNHPLKRLPANWKQIGHMSVHMHSLLNGPINDIIYSK